MAFETREERQKFYQSKEWRNLRMHKLSKNPLCEKCFREGFAVLAEEVHHIIDIKDDVDKSLDFDNLMSLCKKHHSQITIKNYKEEKAKQKKKGHIKTVWDLNKIK
jgi:5-methylcytosine-specific restriction endonuclease McrA